MPFIHIESTKFPKTPEEAKVPFDDAPCGQALAEYLADHLKKKGYDIPFTCGEDWGWWVEIKGQPFSLGCCVYGASDATDKPELCVKLSREAERKWSLLRFRFIDTRSRVEKLFHDLEEIFTSDPEVKILGCPEDFPLS